MVKLLIVSLRPFSDKKMPLFLEKYLVKNKLKINIFR